MTLSGPRDDSSTPSPPVYTPGKSWFGAFTSVFAARGVSSAATFLTIALLGRSLGRTQYGDFVVLLTVLKVASELLNPALDTALVRFVGAAQGNAASFARAVLRAKVFLAIATLCVGAALVFPLREFVFAREGVQVPLYALGIAFAAAAFTILATYVQSRFQAAQQFGAYALFEIAAALLRLLGVAALAYTQHDSITNLFIANAAAPVIVAAFASMQLPALERAPVMRDVWRDLFGYAKWVAAACACTSLAQRVDVFFVASSGVLAEAMSDYGAALQLTLIGDLVIITLFNILLPHASRMTQRAEVLAFLRGFKLPTFFAMLGLVPLLLCSGLIARLTFGAAYAQAGPLFAILLVGTGFALASAPAGAALYGLGSSRTIAGIECAKLLGVLVGGSVVVPVYGVVGMAWTVSAVKGLGGLLTYALAVRQATQMPETSLDSPQKNTR